jgi:hypothetical protein
LVIGLFNAAVLPVFAAAAVVQSRKRTAMLTRIVSIVTLTVLVVTPWFVRNERVFHGQVLLSTQTGANMVQGVLTSQGRTQPGDTEKLNVAMGWSFQNLETNGTQRLSLPSEVELNRQAAQVVPHLWAQQSWKAIPLLARKVADFWLSTDQFLDITSLTVAQRSIRMLGVLAYLVVLGFAFRGIVHLCKTQPKVASLFILYAVGFTILHLPFVMNTRLRIPLMEPLIIILAGVGSASLGPLFRYGREEGDFLKPPDTSATVTT